MAIKKYFADADNTITNAFKDNLTTRGIDANMGQSDILETFLDLWSGFVWINRTGDEF